MLILALTTIAAGLSLGVTWLATRSITRPLGQVVAIARRVADGDLTSDIAVDSRDEAGQMMEALRHMNASLPRIVGEVRTSTESMSCASGEIASGNQDLSMRTESQATSQARTSSSCAR